ncbi:HNH endonuclease [Pseudomonas sivasensis]|uniref:HNH endonuclease n=1 Tax=Pseudomonas sivasensis TaxID=1880678 RepID=UPI0015C4A269|nr:hypothetical protein [Pseudomonas sivasensis]
MEENLRRLLLAFNDWLVRSGLCDDACYFTAKKWKKKKEEILNDAVQVITFEGSNVVSMLHLGEDMLVFNELFESFGFYYETSDEYVLGIYPIKDFDFAQVKAGTKYSILLADPRWKRKADLVKMRAGRKCEDCGESGKLEAHHCYYARIGHGFNPWEYPLDSLRALCPECHKEREKVEMNLRAWSAEHTHKQLAKMMDGINRIGGSLGLDKNDLFDLLINASVKDIRQLKKMHERVMIELNE